MYILIERKYYININREDRRFDDRDFDNWVEADEAFNTITDNAGLSVQAYDTPLYHGDYIIKRKKTS